MTQGDVGTQLQRLAVYCGSSPGTDPAYAETAHALGCRMAQRGIGLVYGGGRLGLMGVVADAVLGCGGEVLGVIPEALVRAECAHGGITHLDVVQSMHERKARMTELTDAFLALPGGIGTLDELFEAWTWNALGYHSKPFALLNVAGFWDGLASFMDNVTASGFLSPARRAQLFLATDIDEAIDQLAAAAAAAGDPAMLW